ncbi:MAG: hypothetical protein N4A35_02065 [Flavobacteriales bacterium]|jgi:hypothetical protein|nr:hypothetical protein [Flavobacteriales bacterium]
MNIASITEIRKELKTIPKEQLILICLELGKFKKENKELLNYILFEKEDEHRFITALKLEVELEFSKINTNSYFYIKKSVRRILRLIKKHIKYSKKKETEAELLIHFCEQLQNIHPSIKNNTTLYNIYKRQLILIEKALLKIHEDLQYDFEESIEKLRNF